MKGPRKVLDFFRVEQPSCEEERVCLLCKWSHVQNCCTYCCDGVAEQEHCVEQVHEPGGKVLCTARPNDGHQLVSWRGEVDSIGLKVEKFHVQKPNDEGGTG